METLNAGDVKREFGAALSKAQPGPVALKKNGRRVAVMVSRTTKVTHITN